MKIAVLGATGRTGRLVVQELLQRGHTVQVLVRDPEKLGPSGRRVDVLVGDSREPSDLDRLVQGVDAVVSALGPTSRDGALHTETAEALVGAMGRAGVERFVGVSGAGIDVPGDEKSWSAKLISRVIRIVGGAAAEDKRTEHRVYAASDVTWTLVRPPRLTDGEATGQVKHHAHRSVRSTSITRSDLAVFVADVVEQDLYPRQAPFVAGGR